MKKLWSHIALFFIGLSSGIVIAIKYLVPEKTVFKGRVRLKQSGRGNSQITEISPEVVVKPTKEEKIQARKDKKSKKNI